MRSSSRHSRPRCFALNSRRQMLALALVAGLAPGVWTDAQAARLGHARVVSAPGEPLRIALPVLDITPDEAQGLQWSLAESDAWQSAGLTPPAPLATLRLQEQPQSDPSRRQLILSAPEPLQQPSADVLLALRTPAGQRLLQVTVMVPRSELNVRPAQLGRAAAAPTSVPAGASIRVRQGDTLYGIAQRNQVAGANIHQMLVALWRANPNAFSGDNMSRLKAGARLTLPDAQTVRAIDPAEARRIYIEHVEAYARYRAGLGQAAGGARVAGGSAAAGKVSGADTPAGASLESAQDRLRLSGAAGNDARGDARTSQARELADASGRVGELESNVQALKEAGQGASAPVGSDGERAAAGQAAGAAAAAMAGASPGSAGSPANEAATVSSNSGSAAGTAKAATAGGEAGAGPVSAGGAAAAAGGAAAAGSATDGPSRAATVPGAAESAADARQAGAPASRSAESSLPAWLANNLLIIVTGILALLVLIIAFALRRAGQRRGDDTENSDDTDEPEDADDGDDPPRAGPALDEAALTRRLESINLDLDAPSSDTARRP
ncbi:Tfp pilus assembly protein FimV [Bordetella trematum]|nr:membrane protein [Bordetella trematum]VDH06470.1 Tfp pilus assembly protein FimV [Bordetella trematum]